MCFHRKIKTKGGNYTCKQVDLSAKPQGTPAQLNYLYEQTVLDYGSGYLGHPDSVLLKNGDILTFYPQGHGKGAILSRRSTDGGKTYTDGVKNPPLSWQNSRETPTVYRLEFNSPEVCDKLVLISGVPTWGQKIEHGGFNCSLSCDEGETWSEFELFYPEYITVVAMASLTRLKENGKFVDKWMAFFHDEDFYNYKTILTFDEHGKMCWSKPEKYFAAYRKVERGSKMCEVECIRSDGGTGDELCLITRSNSKLCNSLVSFSTDEGKTWSPPVEAPAAYSGERIKADYLPDGRLIMTFRSIERDEQKNKKFIERGHARRGWYSEGWIAWVGTYDDLKNSTDGLCRIKLAHTYLSYQNEPETVANGDCGYCGNVVLPDSTFVTSTYGIFSPDEKRNTYIISKRIKLEDIEKLL